jgi:hypothetical protein
MSHISLTDHLGAAAAGSITPRRHHPRAAGLHQIRDFYLYVERICYHEHDKYLYAGYNDVELVEQAVWYDVLTLWP